MDERIHVLAEQAGLYCDGTPDNWDKEAIERFAKLIAKECAEICLEANDHKNILRRFGVTD
jgi:hypothetical protein